MLRLKYNRLFKLFIIKTNTNINIYNFFICINKLRIKLLCDQLGYNQILCRNKTTIYEWYNNDIVWKVFMNDLIDAKLINIKKNIQIHIKEYMKILNIIKTYKYYRILKGLPVNGQQTHTNAKTAKRFGKIRHHGFYFSIVKRKPNRKERLLLKKTKKIKNKNQKKKK